MIAVVGSGAWGTTLAILLARGGRKTALITRSPEQAQRLRADGENKRLMPGYAFPSELEIAPLEHARMDERNIVLLVVPSQHMRANVRALRPYLAPGTILVSAAKGLEVDTCKRMSEVIADEVAPEQRTLIAALSGPNLSAEVARGLPTASVVAAATEEVAREVQAALRLRNVRLYTNIDIVGVELGGALKNIVALGAGACDGLGYGDNAKAAFLTRGLAEIARLGTAMGANPLTFAGLAGIGDLMATCASALSRNRYVGEQIGRGRSLKDIQGTMAHVAEGVTTTIAARSLAEKYGVDMPITATTYRVLFEGLSPKEGVEDLLVRDQKGELTGITLQPGPGRLDIQK